jgi:hypothetical protein
VEESHPGGSRCPGRGVDHVPAQEILATLAELETKIQQGLMELKEMLR